MRAKVDEKFKGKKQLPQDHGMTHGGGDQKRITTNAFYKIKGGNGIRILLIFFFCSDKGQFKKDCPKK